MSSQTPDTRILADELLRIPYRRVHSWAVIIEAEQSPDLREDYIARMISGIRQSSKFREYMGGIRCLNYFGKNQLAQQLEHEASSRFPAKKRLVSAVHSLAGII